MTFRSETEPILFCFSLPELPKEGEKVIKMEFLLNLNQIKQNLYTWRMAKTPHEKRTKRLENEMIKTQTT